MNRFIKFMAAIAVLALVSGCVDKDKFFEYFHGYVVNETEDEWMISIQAHEELHKEQKYDTTFLIAPHDTSALSDFFQRKLDSIWIATVTGEPIKAFARDQMVWEQKCINKSEPERDYWCYVYNNYFIITQELLEQ